jgi:hypothetical protein
MSDEVTWTLTDYSEAKIIIDLDGAPDTASALLPGSPTVRPRRLMLLASPQCGGVWEVSWAKAAGPKVKDGKIVVTKRDYEAVWGNPLDDDCLAPEWLREIAAEWVAKLNS